MATERVGEENVSVTRPEGVPAEGLEANAYSLLEEGGRSLVDFIHYNSDSRVGVVVARLVIPTEVALHFLARISSR